MSPGAACCRITAGQGCCCPARPRARLSHFPRAAGACSTPAVKPGAMAQPQPPQRWKGILTACSKDGHRESRRPGRGDRWGREGLAGGQRDGIRIPSLGASAGGRRRSSGGGSPPGTAPCPRPGRGGGSRSPLLGGCGSAGAAGGPALPPGPGAASARAGSAQQRCSHREEEEEDEEDEDDEDERGAAGSGAGCR